VFDQESDENPFNFEVHVVPHPGEPASNLVGVWMLVNAARKSRARPKQTLRPQVQFTREYPEKPPNLQLVRSTGGAGRPEAPPATLLIVARTPVCLPAFAGLTSGVVDNLLAALNEEARRNVGSVMVYSLIQFAEAWLVPYNTKVPARRARV
jgi:hypothetical protein